MTALLTWFQVGGAGLDVELTVNESDVGETTTMVSFIASDGHRSVRSLTLREVADALVATGVIVDPIEPTFPRIERAAERLWLNQHADRRGWSAPLNVAWDDLPEGRRRWWRHQARCAWAELSGVELTTDAGAEDVGSDSEGPLATWHTVTGSAAPDELQRPRKRRRVVKHARKTGDPAVDDRGGDDA